MISGVFFFFGGGGGGFEQWRNEPLFSKGGPITNFVNIDMREQEPETLYLCIFFMANTFMVVQGRIYRIFIWGGGGGGAGAKDYVLARKLRARIRTHFRQGSSSRVVLMLSRAI